MAVPVPATDEFTGTPRYRVRRRIGSGGMGVVYEVVDEERGGPVALKLLRHSNAAGVYRFKKEFRALADLSHANVVSLHELESDGDRWFFTMDLVEGIDFLRWVRGGVDVRSAVTVEMTPSESDRGVGTAVGGSRPSGIAQVVDEERLRDAMLQLARGLDALHRAKKLHRDVKPSNVLVAADGHVTLVDFGLVKDTAPDFLRSMDEHVLGTPAYTSPEQAANEEVTPASDWYSVGVMLYEALTGTLPFTGSLIHVLTAKQLRDPAPPESLIDEVPEDLSSLCMDLLQRDPAGRPTGEQIIARLRGERRISSRPPSAATVRVGLVGRNEELAALDSALKRAEEHTTIVEVRGPSGYGKSALVQRFLRTARDLQAAVVLRGRCHPRERVPFQALDGVVDALGRHLRRMSEPDVRALLPPDIHAVARMFPALAERGSVLAAVPDEVASVVDATVLRRRAVDALAALLRALSERRRVVLFLDDVQWSDEDGAALLSDLLRRDDPPRCLVVLACRTENAGASAVLRALEGHGVERSTVELDALPKTDAEALAEGLLLSRGADVSRAEAIADESEGIPYFVEELARHAASLGFGADVRLTDALESRFARLEPAARRVLEVVCVAAAPLSVEVALDAAGVGPDAARALAELSAASLVRTLGGSRRSRLEPYHDKVREALMATLDDETTAAAHKSIAASLLAAGSADPVQTAAHLEAGGDVATAARFAREAADRALSALAFDRAAQLYEKTLELSREDAPERVDLLAALGDACSAAGRGPDAADAYLSAVELGHPNAFDLRRRAAERLLCAGHLERGLEVMSEVLSDVGMRLSQTPQQARRGLVVQRTRLRLAGLELRERDPEDLDPEALRRIDACYSAATGLTMVDPIRSAELQAAHLRFALDAGEPYRAALGLALEAGHLATRGLHLRARSEKLLHRASAIARRIDHPHALGVVEGVRGTRAFLLNEWRDALSHCDAALTLLRDNCTHVSWEVAAIQRFHLQSLAYLGELRALSQEVPPAVDEALARGDRLALASTWGTSVIAWMVRGEVETAERSLADAWDEWSSTDLVIQHVHLIMSLGLLDRHAGRAAQGWKRVHDRWSAIENSLVLRVQILRTETWMERGQAALATGDETLFDDVAAQIRRLRKEGTPLANAFAVTLAGSVAARRGTDDAPDLLDSAAHAYEELDMRAYATLCRRRRGLVLGGDEGGALVRTADGWLGEQGVSDAEAFARAVLP